MSVEGQAGSIQCTALTFGDLPQAGPPVITVSDISPAVTSASSLAQELTFGSQPQSPASTTRTPLQVRVITELKRDMLDGLVDPSSINLVSATIIEIHEQQGIGARFKKLSPTQFVDVVVSIVTSCVRWWADTHAVFAIPAWSNNTRDIVRMIGRTSAHRVDVVRGHSGSDIQDNDTPILAITRAMTTAAMKVCGSGDKNVGSGVGKKAFARSMLVASPLPENVRNLALNMVDSGLMEEIVDVANGRSDVAVIMERHFQRVADQAVSAGVKSCVKSGCFGLFKSKGKK